MTVGSIVTLNRQLAYSYHSQLHIKPCVLFASTHNYGLIISITNLIPGGGGGVGEEAGGGVGGDEEKEEEKKEEKRKKEKEKKLPVNLTT